MSKQDKQKDLLRQIAMTLSGIFVSDMSKAEKKIATELSCADYGYFEKDGDDKIFRAN